METIAVFVDDDAYARRMLQPLMSRGGEIRWVLVACAPRLTHRIGKWASHGNRERWRAKWCAKLFDALLPAFSGQQSQPPETVIAKGPLLDVVGELKARHGVALRVLDARRPKVGTEAEPLAADAARENGRGWAVPVMVSSGLSVMLALSD